MNPTIRVGETLTVEGREFRLLARGISGAEGPVVDLNNRIFMVAPNWGQILEITGGGALRVHAETGGIPAGLQVDRENNLWCADMQRGVLRIRSAGQVETMVGRFRDQPIRGCNDCYFDSQGNLYFTAPAGSNAEQPVGQVFCRRADGEVSEMDSGMRFPNGIVVTEDDRRVIVAETYSKRLVAYDLEAPGKVGRRFTFAETPGETHLGADGMDFDQEGFLMATNVGDGSIDIYDRDGFLTQRLRTPFVKVTNVHFLPDGTGSLLITECSTYGLWLTRWERAGQRQYCDSARVASANPPPNVICGYPEQWSVPPASNLDVMVSTDASSFTAQCVRLLHGDPNPAGPGTVMEPLPWLAQTHYDGAVQRLPLGSYAEIRDVRIIPRAFTLCCWICPTAFAREGLSGVFSWGGRNEVSLSLGDNRRLRARVSGTECEIGLTLGWARWYFVGISCNATNGEAKVFAGIRGALGPATVACRVPSLPDSVEDGLLLAALRGLGGVGSFFNGKIGHLFLWNFAADDVELCQLQNGRKPDRRGALLGEWDFSLRIETDQLVDQSGGQRHGRLVQGPTRGVTGPKFKGPNDKVFLGAPQEYDAAYFHQDDLEDARWKPRVAIAVPPDAPSGIYAVMLRDADGSEWSSPFVVRPRPRDQAPLLFVVPTLTWLAYGNRGRPDHEAAFGPSLYGTHTDGSPAYQVSLRRPISTLDHRGYFAAASLASAGVAPCSHLLMADLYLIHWLKHRALEHHVVTDHDLHEGGIELLSRYRAVICAGHHEYWTGAMRDGMETYLSRSGRAVFLTGNALYWVSSIHPQRKHLLEVRRSGGTGTGVADPGESQHSFETCGGGTWQSRGQPPNLITGAGFAATGISEQGEGFRRTEPAPETAFIFEGVDPAERIGNFGLNLGGAAGFELDRADYSAGTPAQAWQVARTESLPPSFFGTVEEGIGRAPVDDRTRGDLVYSERPGGGKVFAAGSVTWTGSLSHRNYRNNVERITSNVVGKFLEEK